MPSRNTPSTSGARARPLALEERQAMIIDATMPLLVEYGPHLTSKQISEAAGVAEGTIFRAFGDKEALVTATIEKFLDPEPLRRELRAIPPDLALDEKMFRIVELMRKRFSDVFRVMTVFRRPHQPNRDARRIFSEIVTEVLSPHLDDFNWTPEQTSHAIRLVTFASSLTPFNAGMEFDSRQLTSILLYGLVGKPEPHAPTLTESQG